MRWPSAAADRSWLIASISESRTCPAGSVRQRDIATTAKLLEHFRDAEAECKALLAKGETGGKHQLALPAYDQAIKASHIFNLLDARGVISVTERQAYILRVRDLAKACCAAWLKTEAGGAGANA